jgi:radical SAM protein with 4Fe4S-binding SPASM domain
VTPVQDEWTHPPQIIQWDCTSKCNLKCRHCRASNLDHNAKDLSFEQAVTLLNQVDDLAPGAALALAGGEPLERRDLKEILEHIRTNLSLSVELLTNATLITPMNISWLSEMVRGFNISMEGSSSDVHDAIRGKGSFDRTISALRLLVKKDVPLAVRMTFFEQEEDEVERLLRFIHDLGVRVFNFRYVVPVGEAMGKAVDPRQYQRLSQRIWGLGQSLDMQIGFSDPFPELFVNEARKKEIEDDKRLSTGVAVTGCSIAFTLLYINPQGIVQLCPYFPVIADDAKQKSLSEIWYRNEKLSLFRYSRTFLKGQCGDCKNRFSCGGCRGAAYAMGDYLGEDPRCWMKLLEKKSANCRPTGCTSASSWRIPVSR